MSESLAISYAAKGVTYFDDNARMAPVTHYAPLYPLVVSALGFAGIDPLEGVRWLNALLFAFNIMLAAWIVFASTHSVAASKAASFLAVTAFPMVQIHSTTLTEPLCLFLGFLGLYLMAHYINGSKVLESAWHRKVGRTPSRCSLLAGCTLQLPFILMSRI